MFNISSHQNCFPCFCSTVHRTPALLASATAEELEAALEALPGVGDVRVLREATDAHGSHDWHVDFLSERGNLPLLAVNARHLRGAAPVNVSRSTFTHWWS